MVTKGKVGLYSFCRRPRKPSVNQTNIQSWVGVNKMVPSFPRLVSSSSSSFAEAGVFLLLLLFFFVSSSFSSSFFRTKNSVLTRRIVGTRRIRSVSNLKKIRPARHPSGEGGEKKESACEEKCDSE